MSGSFKCLRLLVLLLGPALCLRRDSTWSLPRDFAVNGGHSKCSQLLDFDVPKWLAVALQHLDALEDTNHSLCALWSVWLRCCSMRLNFLDFGDRLLKACQAVAFPDAIMEDLSQFLQSFENNEDYSDIESISIFLELFGSEIEGLRAGMDVIWKHLRTKAMGAFPSNEEVLLIGEETAPSVHFYRSLSWRAFAVRQLRFLAENGSKHLYSCSHCGFAAFRSCSGCLGTHFCSTECSGLSWPAHKSLCQLTAKVREAGSTRCSRSIAGEQDVYQPQYECLKCLIKSEDGNAICHACAEVCHRGHSGVSIRGGKESAKMRNTHTLMFCDCRDFGACKME